MKREEKLTKISKELGEKEVVLIYVSEGGRQVAPNFSRNLVSIYEVTCNGFSYVGHAWGKSGDLMFNYSKYVVKKNKTNEELLKLFA